MGQEGEKVRRDSHIYVSFEPHDGHFLGTMAIEEALDVDTDLEALLHKAACLYEHRLQRMTSLVDQIQTFRSRRQPTRAHLIWQLGDEIFGLKDDLSDLSLQINGIYQHLVRDLKVKRKWLEKVVILRRYLPDQSLIPEALNWGQCEKGTRRVAERLRQGTHPQ